MLDKLTVELFQEKEGSAFWAKSDQGESVAFTLTEVEALPEHRGHPLGEHARKPFSLIMQGPEGVRLDQGTVGLTHEVFDEELPFFLVAIGESEDKPGCLIYQAVFN